MATTAFCSWEAARERVASQLHVPADQLAAEWATLCSRGVRDATAELKRVFIGKGYQVADLIASDDIRIWCERLAAFFALCNGVALANYDLKAVEHLDCRKEFAEAGVLIVGDTALAPQPGESEVGGIGHGTTDAVAEAEKRFGRF
jgi:hypothetical protein